MDSRDVLSEDGQRLIKELGHAQNSMLDPSPPPPPVPPSNDSFILLEWFRSQTFHFTYFFKALLIYLKGNMTERKSQRWILSVAHSQMSTIVRAGSGQFLEPGTPFGSPHGWHDPNCSAHHLLPSQHMGRKLDQKQRQDSNQALWYRKQELSMLCYHTCP